jgi:hypothetical protein
MEGDETEDSADNEQVGSRGGDDLPETLLPITFLRFSSDGDGPSNAESSKELDEEAFWTDGETREEPDAEAEGKAGNKEAALDAKAEVPTAAATLPNPKGPVPPNGKPADELKKDRPPLVLKEESDAVPDEVAGEEPDAEAEGKAGNKEAALEIAAEASMRVGDSRVADATAPIFFLSA